MKVKLLNDHEGHRVFAVVLEAGEDFCDGMLAFGRQYHLGASQLSATGGLSQATLGYLDRQSGSIREIPVADQVEVLSLTGTITRSSDVTADGLEPRVHAAVVLGRYDGTTLGGRLVRGTVWPALEILVSESPKYLHRRTDETTGLPLIDISPAEQAPLPGAQPQRGLPNTRGSAG
jgi:predicted DNA-binding protein with PD1-like motif